MTITTTTKALLSIPDAQHQLGDIGRTLLYELIDAGHLTRVKIGARAFITGASVDAYVANLTAAACGVNT